MKIEINTNRNVYKEGNAGTIKENNAEIIEFNFPEELDSYKKYIEIEAEELKLVDIIENNTYTLRNNITKNNIVKVQVVLKDLEKGIVFKSNVFNLRFRESLNLSEDLEEENLNILDKTLLELQRVQESIESYTENLATKQDKEEGKGLSGNDFTNELKEKLERLENYNDIEVKTSIGNLQNEDINIKSDIKLLQDKNIETINQLKTKVDKIEGKDLSQNDFTDDYKNKLDNLLNYDDTDLKKEIQGKVDKVNGKSLSTNDFTNAYKQKLDSLENYNDTNIKTRVVALETNNTINKQEIDSIKQENIQQYTKIETNTGHIEEIREKDIEQDEQISNNVENIELLKNENTELKAECERLKEDVEYLPTIAGNDENITLKDTVDARFKEFGIGGNTIQEGESSIENPSKINNVKENVNITICNKNLADISKVYGVYSSDNTNIERIENGYILGTFTGTHVGDANARLSFIPVYLKKGKRYILTYKYEVLSGNITKGVSAYFPDTSQYIGVNSPFVVKDSDITKLGIYYDSSDFNENNKIKITNLQIEEIETQNSVATEYEKHQEQNFTLNLGEIELCKIGNNKDYIYHNKTNNKWYKREVIEKEVLDGQKYFMNEAILHISTVNIFSGLLIKGDTENVNKLISNRWKAQSKLYAHTDINGIYISDEGNVISLYNPDLKTVEEWTVWFNENPSVLYGVLANPVDKEITDETLIAQLNEIEKKTKSYKWTTHVYSIDEISPIFEVEARKDIQAMFNNLQAQILANEEV